MLPESQRDFSALQALLASWNLSHLFQHFREENINIEEMRMMNREHIATLLAPFQLGYLVRFEYFFDKWRRNQRDAVPLSYQVCSTTIRRPLPRSKQENKTTNTEAVPTCDVATNTYFSPPTTPSPLQRNERQHAVVQPAAVAVAPSSNTVPASYASSLENPKRPRLAVDSEHAQAVYREMMGEPPPHNLLHILQSSGPKGMAVLEYYQQRHELTTAHRYTLIHVIVDFFDRNEFHLSLNMSHKLEYEIVNLFPTEKLEYYRTEKRGKIYVKYTNLKRYQRQKNIVAKPRLYNSSFTSSLLHNESNETNSVDLKIDSVVDANQIILEDDDEISWATDVMPVQVKTETLSDEDDATKNYI